MKILMPFGTRPEIVKLSPVIDALTDRGFALRTVATGQHADPEMADSFFADLGVEPDERWQLGEGEANRVAGMMASAFTEVGQSQPDVVLLLGDTYTVPVFCLAARRHGVPVAHLEAGLRSFNDTSMEEVNRKIAGATASLHFAPTELAARFLRDEGVPPERVRVVGNPVIDVLRSVGLMPRPPGQREGVVITAHRASNVDDPVRLLQLVELILRVADSLGPVTFPVHPRTRERLLRLGELDRLNRSGINLLPPVPYARMLDLVAGARVVLTDSGGLQEEASWLGVPVVVLRKSTPRWEGVRLGTSAVVGLDVDLALETAVRFCEPDEQERVANVPCPYGDGHTSEVVADTLADPSNAYLLQLNEPDFVGKEPFVW